MHYLHFNYRLLINELQSRGVICRLLPNTEIVECEHEGKTEYLMETCNSLIPSNYYFLANDKLHAKMLLLHAGLPTAPFELITTKNFIEAAEQIEHSLSYPVCLKPPHLTHGYFVHPFLENRGDLQSVWEKSLLPENFHTLIAEQHVKGDDVRIFLMESEEPVVLLRKPPEILGNGKDSLGSLIEKENKRRMNPRINCLCDIYLKDPDGMRCLKKQNLTLDSIPEENRRIPLLYVSNVTYGGTCENITGKIHRDYLDLANRVFSLFPGLPYLAIDLLIENFQEPLAKTNAQILELCTNPGFSLFEMPSSGTPVPLVSRIADRLFPQTKEPQ